MENCFILCKAAYSGNGVYFWGFWGSGGCKGRCPYREDLVQRGLWGARKIAATDFPNLMWDRDLALQNVEAACVGSALLSPLDEPRSRRK